MLTKLSKLLAQIGELFFKRGSVLAKGEHLLFQKREAFGIGEAGRCAYCGFWHGLEDIHVAGEEMGVASFLGARLPGKDFDDRGLPLHQVLEAGLDGAQVVEGMHALGASAKFAGSLGAAEQ